MVERGLGVFRVGGRAGGGEVNGDFDCDSLDPRFG